MPLAPTPDIEADLAARIAELAAAAGFGPDFNLDGPGKNLWAEPERPADAVVGDPCTFVEYTSVLHDENDDGACRFFDLQVLHRLPRGATREDRRAALARLRKLYDVVHRSGDFVGASGHAWSDIRAIDSPRILEDRHLVLNVTLWSDT